MDDKEREALERYLWALVGRSTLSAVALVCVILCLQIFVNMTGITLQSRDVLIIAFLPWVASIIAINRYWPKGE